MKLTAALVLLLMMSPYVGAFQMGSSRPDLTQQQTYIARRSSSADCRGANRDFRPAAPGATQTILDVNGPGAVTHIWIAAADREPLASKLLVLRMYWDNESTPSVETPLGDFFGLGLGECIPWHSEVLQVSPVCGLNSYFNMPFAHHARITIENQGKQPMWGLFYNIDYRSYRERLPKGGTLLPCPVPSSPTE